MNPRYPSVARRAGHRCEYCHAPEVAFNFPFEVEHIAPSSHGGAVAEENLALGCRSCNLFKSDRINGRDPVSGETVRLFHPRQDRWEEHFAIELDNVIIGLTPIGRATVEALRMNSPHQLEARRQWRVLQMFP